MELPEVEVMRRDLEKDVVGKRIREVEVRQGPNALRVIRRHNRPGAKSVRKEFTSLLAGRKIDALVFVEDVKHFIRCVANRSWRLDHPHRNRFALQHLAGSELVDRSDDGHSWIML